MCGTGLNSIKRKENIADLVENYKPIKERPTYEMDQGKIQLEERLEPQEKTTR